MIWQLKVTFKQYVPWSFWRFIWLDKLKNFILLSQMHITRHANFTPIDFYFHFNSEIGFISLTFVTSSTNRFFKNIIKE